MKILSEDGKSYIEITFIESEFERIPSIHVTISVQNEGFSASNSVWLWVGELERFLSDIDVIDMRRNGKAYLNSMSPDEFEIDFETFDRAGHIKVTYKLSRCISYPFIRSLQLQGGFQVDSSEFTGIVKGFRSLRP